MEGLFGNRPISLKALTDFSRLDEVTIKHLKNVYSSLAISMLAAAVGSTLHLFTSFLKGGFLSSIGGIAFIIMLRLISNEPKNQTTRLGCLVAFAGCTGLSLGPLLDRVIEVNPAIISTAFFATTLIFICFTLSALKAKERSYLYLGGTLMSALSILVILGISNIFFRSQIIHQLSLYGGLLLFCGFILFDTQLIIEKRRNGDTDFLWHSVDLFLDFINIFRRIMIILSDKEKKDKKKN